MRLRPLLIAPFLAFFAGCVTPPPESPTDSRQWLAGDHHVHSRFSVGWDHSQQPPAPIIGGDAIYPIPMNALMARRFGLAWMVATDHGGPNHSKISLERTYPETRLSREVVPDVIQFFGLELNAPAGDHSSLIIPHSHDEALVLFDLESRFDRFETWPVDPARDTETLMTQALRTMDTLHPKPVVIAHHPSRSAIAQGVYGLVRPAELRARNDVAPEVAVGMEGAPGHQALALDTHGNATRQEARGWYTYFPTLGGFDQMTARLGGFWDSMLGEGRRWWITASSDSHIHYTEGGADFWPGEYSKTYVYADRDYDAILDALRAGRVFVTTGDLVSELYVDAGAGGEHAAIGGTLSVPRGMEVTVTIRFVDPEGPNHGERHPVVRRVDLILGEVRGRVNDRNIDVNPTTRVVRRFTASDWRRQGPYRVMSHTLEEPGGPVYVRVRGTNGEEPEPLVDVPGEDPWEDLWFYSNPVFITPD